MEAIAVAKTAFAAVQPYFGAISAVSSIFSGVQSYQQGLNQAAEARIKSKQVKLDADLKSLNKEQEGVALAKRQQAIAASLLAKAAAGNIDPFTGSAKDIANINETYLGEDLLRIQRMQEQYKTYGDVMSSILNNQAESYEKAGAVGFIKSIGTASYLMSTTYTPAKVTPTPTTAVPGYSGYRSSRLLMDSYDGPTSMFEGSTGYGGTPVGTSPYSAFPGRY